jgi:DNA-binding NarL/FixJ family response regulator
VHTERTQNATGILADICPLLAEGRSDEDIAQLLHVSEALVEDYLSWLMQALGVTSRVELLLYFYSVQSSSVANHNTAAAVKHAE